MVLLDFMLTSIPTRYFHHFVENTAAQKLLQEIHGSKNSCIHIGVHFATKHTTIKILRIGYYWPSIFKDSYKFTQAYDECQKISSKEKFSSVPLQPVLPNFPFSKR